MNWLTDFIRPRISTQKKREVAANVWSKCPNCSEMLYTKELAENLFVCTACNHHLKWKIDARLNWLLDEGYTSYSVPTPSDDPLKFKDKKRYADRLKSARENSTEPDAYRVVKGSISGENLILAALDFNFMAGSMSRHVGAALTLAAETALAENLPLIIITASGGARMQEGILSLMQMARTTAAIVKLKEAKLPYITLLTDPTTGGVTASFAMQGDVLIGEPGAQIAFAGKRVIAQTIGEDLPEGFQTAEYLLNNGMLDMVLPREQQKATLQGLLSMLMSQHKSA